MYFTVRTIYFQDIGLNFLKNIQRFTDISNYVWFLMNLSRMFLQASILMTKALNIVSIYQATVLNNLTNKWISSNIDFTEMVSVSDVCQETKKTDLVFLMDFFGVWNILTVLRALDNFQHIFVFRSQNFILCTSICLVSHIFKEHRIPSISVYIFKNAINSYYL